MRIAIVHDYLRETGGAERVLDVLAEMFPEAVVFTSYYADEIISDELRRHEIRTTFIQKLPILWQSPNVLERRGWDRVTRLINAWVYFLPAAFASLDVRAFDLVISSSSYCADRVRTRPGQMHVCYCHTPPRFLWQYSERYEGSSIKGRVWKRFVELLRRWDRRAVQRVDHFIANSENVRRRIKRFYDREAAVVYPQVDLLERVRDFEPSGENGGYYLVVSRLDEMKRVEVIVEAFNTSGKPLVIVGTGKLDARMLASANKNISFTGFLTDRELCLYYDRCEALVIAAIDEDFGITAVEAQLFGKPVIAPAEGGFLETVVDGETGVLYEMDGPPSIVKAVERARMIQFDTNRIKENAARFSKAAFIQGISTELARIGVAIPK